MRRIPLVLAFALAACGGPHRHEEEFPVPDGPPDAGAAAADELPAALIARVDHALEFMDTVATAAEATTSDCVKMGASLQALADGPDGKVLIEMDLDPDYRAHSAEVAERYSERLGQLSNRIGVAIHPCDTKPVNDALTQIGLQ
jgi:uncharacterized lipoprotein YmbA